VPNSYTRTNFRVEGPNIVPGALASHIAIVSASGTLDAGGLLTISMGGKGVPSFWLDAQLMSSPTGNPSADVGWFVNPTNSFSGSIGWVKVYASTTSASGASARIFATALIGSV
jgi:hypothetical protein